VVGGGPTGVELAGALAELARLTLARDFRRIDPRQARILLVEAADRVLPAFDAALSAAALRGLERLGVTAYVGRMVTGLDPGGVNLGEERIAARTVLWAAGVRASPLARTLGAPLDRAGRVLVEPDLSVPGHPEIFVIGDLAAAKQRDGSFVPGLAPAAIQEGRHAARNILRRLRGEPTRPFHYLDKGTLATIGRGRAVAAIRRLRLSGFVAWLAWLFIHIWFLVGFRNRVAVVSQWAWHYLTNKRGTRLITDTAEQAEVAHRFGAAPPDLERTPLPGAGATPGTATARAGG
jgi:NADH dehydrogenase